ncbi:Eco57I restriction-modification methylase domain-containing protein [Polaromonas sp.]|uniref:Eco57I restriction-modification methylase domain-containing protein n=1 Tax=Polaromonas sp. TaxID=1869339 RepID=UPI003BB63F19
MSKLDFPSFEKHLRAFDFTRLFVDVLGWNRAPAEGQWQADTAGETPFTRRTVAELGGVVAIQIVADGGWLDEAQRLRVWKHIAHRHAENLLIFTDSQDKASQSQWYWVKRDKHPETGKPRLTARRHEYFRGQPVDLFASKLQAMVVELSELDATGRLPVLEAARRIQAALDVDKTTKKFFTAYQQQHLELLAHIKGIDNERDKRWYASVLLNRLMFVWFLQKKGFLDLQRFDYLHEQLQKSEQRGPDRFFGEFLNALFFEAFAKPEAERSPEARALTGQIPYLNGGLFLHHKLELDAAGQPRVGATLTVADAAFKGIFDLFASFTWHLDDTPGGDADEINPDVLGYIFEKYINQKAFGAYYTRPEITGYLAERSIHQMILERVHEPAIPELGLKEVSFNTVSDLLARMDARTALKLVNDVLPGITILDPAVGSGAFLVAALKCLINVYYAIVGRAEMGASSELKNWLTRIQQDHASVGYYIKRRIVTDNLHGVDIMEEACEIAKLRLFLAMVSSVRRVEDLEPLPNIDFNILPGNSLVGLMRVDEVEFNQKNTQLGLFAQIKPRPFAELLATKNRKLDTYRHCAEQLGQHVNLRELRDGIDAEMRDANGVMNELLRDQFEKLDVRFEQATWDAARHALGKPQKRPMETGDIQAQTPFHWGYVFDDIVQRRGGFDIILANPPWEVFKPQAKEFFAEYSEVVSKNKMTIKEFEKESAKLLQNPEVQAAWLAYESRFPHMSGWFRAAPEFKHQSAVVGGKKTGSDVNLYKLFVERSFHLLRPGGHCGMVIPSGIYTDLGAKGLRDLLFEKTHIQGLFCFENRKTIFEGVDSRFKFVVLTFEKSAVPRLQQTGEANASASPDDLLAPQAIEEANGGGTKRFPAAFMRHEVAELSRFPGEGALWLDVELIKRLSPDSHSVMELKTLIDLQWMAKVSKWPTLESPTSRFASFRFTRESDPTSKPELFSEITGEGLCPVVDGRNIHQFTHRFSSDYRFWTTEKNYLQYLRTTPLKEQLINHRAYRLGFRKIARNTDERTMIATVLNPSFVSESFQTLKVTDDQGNLIASYADQLYLCAIFDSFVFDALIRLKVTANMNFFFVYGTQVPDIAATDCRFMPIVHRAARLICTTPEFDDLAQAVGLKSHKDGATDPTERARLRAELDGLVAHLYGLSEAEFAHILGTFPLVSTAVKVDAHNAYRRVANGLID